MTEEKKGIEGPLTYWELIALERAAQDAIYASSGSSAIFDAAWELERRGLLSKMWRGGNVTYLEINQAGQKKLAEEKARIRQESLGPERAKMMREYFLQLLDKVGVPREEYDTILLSELAKKFDKK